LHLRSVYDIINELKIKKRRAVPGFGKGRKVGGLRWDPLMRPSFYNLSIYLN